MKMKLFNRRGLFASLVLTLVLASLAVALPSFAESNPISSFVNAVFSAGETFEKQDAAATKAPAVRLETGSVSPVQPFFMTTQTCGVLDDFNRADSTNMGANWTEEAGDMQILNNRAVASVNHSRLVFNGSTTGDRACADVFAGSGLQFGGIYLKWTSSNDHLFVKVQDNDGNGFFERVFFMRENSLGFNLACNGGFLSSSPFSSARLYAYIDGSNFVLDIDTNFDGSADQTYSCNGVPSKSGTRTGLGFFGQSTLDNFGIPNVTLTVTKTADTNDGVCDADCSLREAIAAARSGDVIEFASPLFDSPQEIQINGQLLINKNLTINGRGAKLLTVRQMAAGSRVFEIQNVTTASLSGMTITGGNLGLGNGAGITANYSNSPVPPGLTLNFSGLNITGNMCGGGGCGINATSYNLNLLNSTVSNNVSSFSGGVLTGGGIQLQNGSTFNLINSTVSGNRAGNVIAAAGGIWFNGSTANIINSTITDNEIQAGNDRAGGVYNRSGTINVRNSIIAGNRNNTNVPDVTRSSFSSIVSNGNNFIGSAPTGIGFTDGVNNDRVGSLSSPFNPMLDALGNNGGSTPTHALLANSQAINNGNNCVTDLSCSSNNPSFALTTDQRGVARTGNVDIGAFEFEPPVDSTPPVITPIVSGTLGNNGWYVSDVQISWTVTDEESTVSSQTGCDTQSITADTSGMTFTCQATSAGGSNSQSVTIKRDASAPTIAFASRTTPNANGWNNSNVAVEWNCADTLSGAISSSVTTIVSTEGANQSALGICTDDAGNTAQNTQSGINIDIIAPQITFHSRTTPNSNGWNNTNVQLNWNCSDTLSGVIFGMFTQTVSSEGTNQSSTGNCLDLAGNQAQNTQSGVNIDKTAPIILYLLSQTPAPNADGWYNMDLTLKWSCSDALSGVVQTEVIQTISTEGRNLSSTGTCADLAGNTDSVMVGSFKIDKTAPTIAFDSRTPAPNASGWNNINVHVNWTCSDTLSGAVNQNVSQTVSSEGANQSAMGTCSDLARNQASNTQSGIKIDKTAPTITFNSRTAPNGNGWNNSDVTVNWNCSDALSDAVNSAVIQSFSTEGANLSSTGTCFDLAGNSASNTQSGIKIDKTAPNIGFVSRTAPNAAGWNNSNVTVNWSCSDALSGATNSGVTQTIINEGVNQSATGTCFDLAGNSASNTQSGIRIDKTAPVITQPSNITISLPQNSNATSVVVNFALPTATDNLSTAMVTTNPVSGAQFAVGATIVKVTATDAAGNMSMSSFTVTVLYQFKFFEYSDLLSNPNYFIEATAGSDVSVRFSLSGFKGNNPYSSPPVSQRINCSNKSPMGAAQQIQTRGGIVNYDSTFDIYVSIWRTQVAWAGTCRRITLSLKDGTTHSLDFFFK